MMSTIRKLIVDKYFIVQKVIKMNFMKWRELNLKPADRIVVPKSDLRIVQHHAIYLGQNHQGQDLIAENVVGVGVRLITVEEFFNGVIEIAQIERFRGGNYERKLAVQKALNKLGQPYHLINYNCQHFANDVQFNKVESKQVSNVISGLKIILGILLFIVIVRNLFNNKRLSYERY